MKTYWLPMLALLSACGSQPEPADGADAGANQALENQAGDETASADANKASFQGCPFRKTQDWMGSVEQGRLLVTGQVDLQMAGMRPTLTPRSGEGLAFDLALTPEPQAAVSNQVRYERSGSPPYRSGEIYCGGERIATFNVVVVAG